MTATTQQRRSPLDLFPDKPTRRLYDRIIEVLRVRLRTVQELLGHSDVRTTMIYAHVLNQGGRGVGSPADFDGRIPINVRELFGKVLNKH